MALSAVIHSIFWIFSLLLLWLNNQKIKSFSLFLFCETERIIDSPSSLDYCRVSILFLPPYDSHKNCDYPHQTSTITHILTLACSISRCFCCAASSSLCCLCNCSCCCRCCCCSAASLCCSSCCCWRAAASFCAASSTACLSRCKHSQITHNINKYHMKNGILILE